MRCPTAGLDVKQRPTLLRLLEEFHRQNTHIIMGFRPQDPLPEWVTHVAYVRGGSLISGAKDSPEIQSLLPSLPPTQNENTPARLEAEKRDSKALVEIRDLNVAYHGRKVCVCDTVFGC